MHIFQAKWLPQALRLAFSHTKWLPQALRLAFYTQSGFPKRCGLHFQRAQAYKNHPMATQAFPEASPERADLSPKRELDTPAAACSRSLQESAAACSRSLQESPTCRLGPKPELEPKPQLAASAPQRKPSFKPPWVASSSPLGRGVGGVALNPKIRLWVVGAGMPILERVSGPPSPLWRAATNRAFFCKP